MENKKVTAKKMIEINQSLLPFNRKAREMDSRIMFAATKTEAATAPRLLIMEKCLFKLKYLLLD